MGVVRLPYGPWKSLLVGKYENRDVSIYQNPQRDVLYVVVDRDEEGKAKGLVVTIYRGFYVERGDVRQLLNHLSGSPVGVSKKWKGELFQYLLVPAGIKYVSLEPDELKKTVEEMVVTLGRIEKNVILLSRTLGLLTRPLSRVPKNVAAILFIEPTVIAGLSPVRAGAPTSEGALILGELKTGGTATESPVNLRRCVIYGNPVGRKRMFQVLLEEFLRNGVNALVVTDSAEKYSGLSVAATKTELHSKLGLEPVGFSVEELETVIDISAVPPKALVEVVGVRSGTKTAAKMVEVLEAHGMDVERPGELVEKIDGTDLVSLRVGRIFKALDIKMGGAFKRVSFASLVSLSSTGLGGAHVLEVKTPWDHLALVSYVAGIGRALERRGKSENVRFVLFVENAEKIFTRTENPVTKALMEVIEVYKDYGLGWVLEVEKDVLLNDMVLALSEAKLGAVGENDVGVRTLVRRPYRLEIRPYLTAASIEARPAPSASSPPAPQPVHT